MVHRVECRLLALGAVFFSFIIIPSTATDAVASSQLSRTVCVDALTRADQDHDELLTRDEFWEAMHQLASYLGCSALKDQNQAIIAIDNTFEQVVCLCLTNDIGENDPLCCPAGDGNVNSKLRLPTATTETTTTSSMQQSEGQDYPVVYTDAVCQSMVQVLQEECIITSTSARQPSSGGAQYEPMPPPVEVSSLLNVKDLVDPNDTNNNQDDTSSAAAALGENEQGKGGIVGSSTKRLMIAVAVTVGGFLLIVGLICARYRRRQRVEQDEKDSSSWQTEKRNTEFVASESGGVNVTFVSSDE